MQRLSILCALLLYFTHFCQAVFVPFTNCLDSAINSTDEIGKELLQWIPLYLDARFDTKSKSHSLNLTFYGNVTGQANRGQLPPPSSPEWSDPAFKPGKIPNITASNNITTINYDYEFLSYTPYKAAPSMFCDYMSNGTQCPIAPIFHNVTPQELRSFAISTEMNSSYRFATLANSVQVLSGQTSGAGQYFLCVSSNITPDLGTSVSSIVTFAPLAILVCVAVATIVSAIFSPWGTANVFKWTSNYSRDRDILRLATPGFGDCLQYIQFIVLAGSLSLNYPGYYQPVASKVSWSTLMFNESFVSGGEGFQSLQDGVYVYPGNYGLTRMRELVGMSEDEDMWAGIVIWTLVIIAAVVVVCQVGFSIRFVLRKVSKQAGGDLRSLNWPFTGGNLVRVVCHYFLLPIVAATMFEFVISSSSPGYVTALAAILLVLLLAFAGWILKIILTTEPRSRLFDELPIVLLYGPLYNTYTDEAAPFALIPALLTLIRGIAIGAIQASGIIQIVILAVCEVVNILTLHAFRPFRSQTSMNAYHTFFATARLAVVLLSVAFVGSLGVSEGTKGWIGYAIMLVHAIVLVLGFFLSAIQRLFEVVARVMGAGGEEGTGTATRGDLVKAFGMRQLSRRARRQGFRPSMTSEHPMLTDDGDAFDNKSTSVGQRSRSISASSAILLSSRTPERPSSHLDRTESGIGPETPAERTTFSYLPEAVRASQKPDVAARPEGPYYRAPRPRRPTGELTTPGAKSRGSWIAVDPVGVANEGSATPNDRRDSDAKLSQALSHPRNRENSDANLNDLRRGNVDYAVREVDFYYGVRGPALSNQPTRKLKTGPADPVGPVSSATGWFKGLFGRKTKDSGKGFEVVRSTRAPPEPLDESSSPVATTREPYHDTPPSVGDPPAAPVLPGQRTRSTDGDRDTALDGSADGQRTYVVSRDGRLSDAPPLLGPIDVGGSNLGIPSRVGSHASSVARQPGQTNPNWPLPDPTQGASQRDSRTESTLVEPTRLSTVPSIDEPSSPASHARESSPVVRVPFTNATSGHASRNSIGAESALSIQSVDPPFAHAANAAEERPTSIGYVNQFRASDSINPGRSRVVSAASAELVDRDGERPYRYSDVSDMTDP